MMKLDKMVVASLAVLLSVSAFGQTEEPVTEKKWKLQAGWAHQWGRKMSVRGPAPSWYRRLVVPSAPSSAETPPGWNYIDGYVLPDDQSDVRPGGDPNNPYSTHNWHYENPGQYSGGEMPTVTFQRGQQGLQYAGSPTGKTVSDGDLPDDGFEIKLSRRMHTWTNINTDLELVIGAAFFPDTHTMTHTRTTSQSLVGGSERHIYLDYFGTAAGGGWQPTLDTYGPGYYGEFNTIPGDNPIIPLEPYRIESDSYGTALIQDTVRIEGNLQHIRGELGITLRKPLTSRLSAYVSPQFALEFVDVSVRRKETVTITQNGSKSVLASRTQKKDETDIIPGFLLTAGVDCMVTENWFVGGSVGWEWLADDVEVDVGPDTAVFDLDGGEYSIYLGRKF